MLSEFKHMNYRNDNTRENIERFLVEHLERQGARDASSFKQHLST